MRLIRIILVSLLLVCSSLPGLSAEPSAAVPAAEQATQAGGANHEEHGLPPGAPRLGSTGSSFVTSSMVVTWIVALGLIIFARVATRRMQLAPAGAQNFLEWLVETLYEFLEGVIGSKLVHRTFWFFATIFIFILSTNWFGLVPGVGTIGWGATGQHGFEVTRPLLRGGNADLNMTFSMAMIFFVCWIVWAIQSVGVKGIFLDLFGPKGDTTGALKILMIVVFFLVGFLEVLSILFRPISLSFRLYGNIYAGENMLEAMERLVPGLGWLLPVPFYFMELLVGIVQALVFMLLTAVFTMLICMHEEEPGGAAH
ncbi:MAG: F0F1 ATP synthase subunit A [Limisphaerales bacterium]